MSEAQEAEAIMKVIETESAEFWNKDFEAWARCWLHATYVRTMGWWARGGITVVEGWEQQSAGMKRLMEANPKPNPTAGMVRRDNVNLRLSDNMAWVTFDQHGLDTGEVATDMPGVSRETRILEKHGGQWKIVYGGWLLQGTA